MKRIIKTVPFSIPFARKGSYYRAGNSAGSSTGYPPIINRMYSQFMCFPEDITIDQLVIYVPDPGAAGSVSRMGLYADNGALHPGQLLYGSGEFDTTTICLRTAVPPSPIVIAKGTPFWTCFICGVAAPTPISSNTSCLSVLGTDDTLEGWSANGVYADQAYGALPATHPAGTFLEGMYDYVRIRVA